MNKYEFTGVTKEHMHDGKLHLIKQIKAIRDIEIHSIKAGTLGGWLSEESNLSQTGDAWLTEDSYLVGQSSVSGDVLIYDSNIFDSSVHGAGMIDVSNVFSSELANVNFNNVINSDLSSVNSGYTEFSLWNANLKNVHVNKSVLFMESSTLESRSEVPLLIEVAHPKESVRLYNSQIFISAEFSQYSKLHMNAEIRNVNVSTGQPLTCLVGYESFSWINLKLKNIGFFYGSLHVNGQKINGNGHSILKGTEENTLSLTNATIQSQSSEISGDVYIEGSLQIENSKITDMASVINKSEYDLILKRVQLSEMASIQKTNNISSQIDDSSYNADQVVILDEQT